MAVPLKKFWLLLSKNFWSRTAYAYNYCRTGRESVNSRIDDSAQWLHLADRCSLPARSLHALYVLVAFTSNTTNPHSDLFYPNCVLL